MDYWEEFDSKVAQTLAKGLGYLLRFSKLATGTLDQLMNYGRPVYKHVKALGNAGPVVEGLAGALLQAAQDADDPSFSSQQKFFRAAIVGAEDALTDIASSPVGTLAGEVGATAGADTGSAVAGPIGGIAGAVIGGIAGYVGGNYFATRAIDTMFWQPLNESFRPDFVPVRQLWRSCNYGKQS